MNARSANCKKSCDNKLKQDKLELQKKTMEHQTENLRPTTKRVKREGYCSNMRMHLTLQPKETFFVAEVGQ